MVIGVLSDTHLRQGQTLPRFVWEALSAVEMILHAGDVTSRQLLMDLAVLAPVIAVRGNCDAWDFDDLPLYRIVECNGKRMGLVHGNVGVGKTTVERARNTFVGEQVHAVIFGHSHSPLNEIRDEVLLFNPGSPTDKRREKKFSLGLLTINEIGIRAKHLYF